MPANPFGRVAIARAPNISELPATVFPLAGKLLNERMIAQQGLFTVGSHLEMAHDDVIQRMLSHTVLVTFGRWEIAAELKPKFLAHLRSMNITARSLFPGLDGFGKSIE